MAPLRCLIVDDSPHFLRSARALLERGGVSVVGTATTVEEALRRTDELRPDIVLVDVHLGVESGFSLVRRLEQEAAVPAPRMILTSTFPADEFPEMIKATSAAGFIPKAALSASAIREILGCAHEAVEPGSTDSPGR